MGELRFDTGVANYGASTRDIGGEDTGFALALEREGKEIVYVPEAIVAHIINAEEMSLPGVFRRLMRIGRGVAARTGRNPFALVETAAKAPALGVVAVVMLGLRRENDAALWMAKGAIQLGKFDYILRGSGR